VIVPALLQAGEICWVGVRNPKENPDHADGEPKFRPAILFKPSDEGWVVIGTTSHNKYESGDPRIPIPSELWEDVHPGLPRRPGFLWGDKAPWVQIEDIGSHIGWASPPLRALAARNLGNVRQPEKNTFLRLRPDELAAAEPTDDVLAS
jgi:hypothetical protein